MPPDSRDAAARVMAWTLEHGAVIENVDDADGLHVDPTPPVALDALLDAMPVRLCIASWLEDAAERWPHAWAIGSPLVRTFLASRSCACIAFAALEHVVHDRRTAHHRAVGASPEHADLFAIGDILRDRDALTLDPMEDAA